MIIFLDEMIGHGRLLPVEGGLLGENFGRGKDRQGRLEYCLREMV